MKPSAPPDSSQSDLVSPDWFLAGIDPPHDRFHFARVSQQTYRDSAFLDHRITPRPSEMRSLTAEQLCLQSASASNSPAAWIFHTAFCCSTLLAFCLDQPQHTLVLREPAVASSLAQWLREHGEGSWDGGARHVMALLSRPYAQQQVLIKPSNYANALLGGVLSGRWLDPATAGQAPRCLMMSSNLTNLVVSVLKKSTEAARLLPGFLQSLMADSDYADRLNLPALDRLDLAQQAVLFWHCQRYHFQQVMHGQPSGNYQALTMEAFLASPEETLHSVDTFLQLGLGPERIHQTVAAGAFGRHSKAGGSYSPQRQRAEALQVSSKFGAEITAARQWARPFLRELPVEPLTPQEDPFAD